MNRQKVKGTLLALVLIASALALASVPASRKSPECIYESSGKATPLSSLKGKVVVMEFLFIRSEHCLRVAQTLNKLHSELGPRGFQPVGVVFDPPNAANASVQSWALMVDYFKLTVAATR
jgi:cytochrome oxidase Cu insertion factor (SCO1/SenC/PrrC family)